MQIHHQRAELINLRRLADRAFDDQPIASAEQAAILALWRSARHYAPRSVIEPNPHVQLITSGWAAWMRHGGDGRRLIFLFLMPGDFIVSEFFGVDGCKLISLTALRTVDATPLIGADSEAPQAVAMIARSAHNYRRLLLDHLTRLTMGSTVSSLANLLLEFHSRSIRSDGTIDGRFSFPIGQRVLGSALGRSAVQVNKVMKQLQDQGLLRVGYDWIEVVQPDKLALLAGLVPRNSDKLFVDMSLPPTIPDGGNDWSVE